MAAIRRIDQSALISGSWERPGKHFNPSPAVGVLHGFKASRAVELCQPGSICATGNHFPWEQNEPGPILQCYQSHSLTLRVVFP